MRADTDLQAGSHNREEPADQGRRSFLRGVIGGAGVLALAPELVNAAFLRDRALLFHNPNTGETVREVYWTPREGYIRESVNTISYDLRDHHNDQVRLFDTNVLDQLYALQMQMPVSRPIHIISAYRSPSTNGWLSERGRGVAHNSFHMQAMALDIRYPDRRISDLYQVARALGAGGVGYYPRSNFIHIDSGPVRYWS